MLLRFILIPVLTAVLLLSCKNRDTGNADNNLTAATVNKAPRHILIDELKRLKNILASADRQKIADIFTFPVADTSVYIYTENKIFRERLKQNNGSTTRAMFIDFFPEISEILQIPALNLLFKRLQVDSLLLKDSLENRISIKAEPCDQFIRIIIEKDLVTLTVGSDSNPDYKRKAGEDDAESNYNELCEHTNGWIFRFDGKKLNLIQIYQAG